MVSDLRYGLQLGSPGGGGSESDKRVAAQGGRSTNLCRRCKLKVEVGPDPFGTVSPAEGGST